MSTVFIVLNLFLILDGWLTDMFDGTTEPFPLRSRTKRENSFNFYFHTFLYYHERFYEHHKGLDKTFWGTTNKCENKNLS